MKIISKKLMRCIYGIGLLSVLLVLSGMARKPVQLKGKFAGKELELFIGSATKPATEEAAKLFEQITGAKLYLHFGGSGKMLSEMKLAQRGDIYFPGSSDFMDLAKKQNLVIPETEKIVIYLIPSINVPKGNPKGIKCLADLAKPGIRIGIGRPDIVCVGLYAVEVMEYNNIADKIRPNIVTYAESCEKVALLASLGSVDAVLGWSVFHYWAPEKIETILLELEQVPRVGYVSAAKSVFCREQELADKFINFLTSKEAKDIYQKWHYFATEEEARKFAKKDATVGGVWSLPDNWK